jgi:hypothetical protein
MMALSVSFSSNWRERWTDPRGVRRGRGAAPGRGPVIANAHDKKSRVMGEKVLFLIWEEQGSGSQGLSVKFSAVKFAAVSVAAVTAELAPRRPGMQCRRFPVVLLCIRSRVRRCAARSRREVWQNVSAVFFPARRGASGYSA